MACSKITNVRVHVVPSEDLGKHVLSWPNVCLLRWEWIIGQRDISLDLWSGLGFAKRAFKKKCDHLWAQLVSSTTVTKWPVGGLRGWIFSFQIPLTFECLEVCLHPLQNWNFECTTLLNKSSKPDVTPRSHVSNSHPLPLFWRTSNSMPNACPKICS